MDHEDRLRRLAVHGIDGREWGASGQPVSLSSHSLALARLGALVSMGGSIATYSELVDAAIDAGATSSDCIDVLEGIIDIVGLAKAVEAAPSLALALGYDIDDLA